MMCELQNKWARTIPQCQEELKLKGCNRPPDAIFQRLLCLLALVMNLVLKLINFTHCISFHLFQIVLFFSYKHQQVYPVMFEVFSRTNVAKILV